MDAVVAGHDVDGATIYVGRAFHEGDMVPAKVIPSKNVAYIPYNCAEIPKYDYQVLVGSGFSWVTSSSGHVPAEAVCAGNQSNGEPLYVGRAHVEGSLSTGKIHPSHNCIYVPFNGAEHSVSVYEVLVAQKRCTWVPSTLHSPLPEGALLAGHDQDGSPMYIGRAFHEGDQIPAKVIPSKNATYICYGGHEILKDSFDVLCHGNISWVQQNPMTRNEVPFAVVAGHTSSGEPLYIGRAHHEGSLTVGKVQKSHGALYIPFGGAEVPIHSEIEILVEN
ncbi:uncharacterized protein LOC116338776 isoform X3 [Contarinia nasturtii]|nr:uncharacterized protein LOC116338776 isoform X3 [Contarinia nasturtii]